MEACPLALAELCSYAKILHLSTPCTFQCVRFDVTAKVGFVSLGCPKNLVDTEVMMGVLARAGYMLTPQAAEADILVINTCSFIAPACQESVETILEMAEYKRVGRAQKLIVTGCLVERFGAEIQKEIPEVDAILGTNQLEEILAACNGTLLTAVPSKPYLYHDLTPRLRATPPHYAYIKIAEGCDHPCSFCIIPQLRGPFRSRAPDSVIREAERLTSEGVREIILIGQDTTSYGEDLGLRAGLARLLARLATLEGLGWLRFLYSHPNRITQELLETLARHEKICHYFDIPLQHASANVLKRMKRGGDGKTFLKLLERIRRVLPEVTLRTSLIVGFPGESEADFMQLCQFVQAVHFDHLGVFTYSDEEGTPSYNWKGKVSAREAEARRRELMQLQKRIVAQKNRARIGQRYRALLEGPCKETGWLWVARLESQAPEIDTQVYINDCRLPVPTTDRSDTRLAPGSFVTVEITAAHDYDLVAAVVGWE